MPIISNQHQPPTNRQKAALHQRWQTKTNAEKQQRAVFKTVGRARFSARRWVRLPYASAQSASGRKP
jgi:hypothetical protein